MNLSISDQASSIAARTLVLTGSARSGTTIVGRLIASCIGVEYGFEPPILVSLLAMLGELPIAKWKLLYETYLYEELLLGSLAGRYLNTNRLDDSCVYRYLSTEETNQRFNTAFRKHELEAQIQANSVKVCFKIPNLLPRLEQLRSLYPAIQPIVMHRAAIPTLLSLLHKGWFNHGSAGDNSSRIYPYIIASSQTGVPCNIPYWVSTQDQDWWLEASAAQRSLYYYIQNTPTDRDKFIVISYEQLLIDPWGAFQLLADKLSLQPGVLTEGIINSIQPQDSALKGHPTSSCDLDIGRLLKCLPAELQARAVLLDL